MRRPDHTVYLESVKSPENVGAIDPFKVTFSLQDQQLKGRIYSAYQDKVVGGAIKCVTATG